MTETYDVAVTPEWITSVGQASLSEQVRQLEAKNAELLATIEQRDKLIAVYRQDNRALEKARKKLIDELAGHMDNAKTFQRSAEYWHGRAVQAEQSLSAIRGALPPDKPRSSSTESPFYGGIDPAECGCGGSGSGWCDCKAGED